MNSGKNFLADFYKNFHPKVEDVTQTSDKQHISKLLGVDPKTNKNVYITYTIWYGFTIRRLY